MKFSISKLCFFAFVLLFSISFFGCSKELQERPTVIYLVRHAEKAQSFQMSDLMIDPSKDPELSEKGNERAQLLKEIMLNKNIAGIFSTSYKRTMRTVEPLSEAISLPIQPYDMQSVNGILDSLITETSGKHYLFSGHSNTILPMIDYLNAERPQEKISENEYDKIFNVVVQADTSLVTVTTY